MNLKPINPEKQLENVLFGEDPQEANLLKDKKAYLIKNLNYLETINGAIVFGPFVNEDTIYYRLSKSGELYYYPIKYANFTFLTLF